MKENVTAPCQNVHILSKHQFYTYIIKSRLQIFKMRFVFQLHNREIPSNEAIVDTSDTF